MMVWSGRAGRRGEQRDLIRLGAHLHLAQHHTVGMVQGGQQVKAGLLAIAGAAQGLAVYGDGPPAARPRYGASTDTSHQPDSRYQAASLAPQPTRAPAVPCAPLGPRPTPGKPAGRAPGLATDTSAPGYFRMLTARATISATVTMEMTDWRAMASFAQRDSGITSVGLNADALVNAR